MSRIDQYRLLNATLFYKIHFKHLRRPSACPDSSCKQIALMKAIVENASDDGKTSRRDRVAGCMPARTGDHGTTSGVRGSPWA